MNKRLWALILASLFTLAFCVTCRLFDSTFAETAIDWLSFLAGTFLVAEGIYRIRRSEDPLFPSQFMRVLRIAIGANIFTIHLIQFIWGVNCKILEATFTQAAIDWFAFSFGIFLIMEGAYKILTARAHLLRDQISRTLRVIIGTCIFTIHLLQFMRY